MLAVRMDRRPIARLDPSDIVQEALVEASQKLSEYVRERTKCPKCGVAIKIPVGTKMPVATRISAVPSRTTQPPPIPPPVSANPLALVETQADDADGLADELSWLSTSSVQSDFTSTVAHDREEADATLQYERVVEEVRHAPNSQDWGARVKAATNVVPEEQALTNRYPALRKIAAVIKVVTIITLLVSNVAWFSWLILSAADGTINAWFFIGVTIGVLASSAWAWMCIFALAELILLAIDVANDLRINRFLLKGIRYQQPGP